MSPIEFIPEDQRDLTQVARDAQTEMERTQAEYAAAQQRYLEAAHAAGITVTEPPKRWQ